MCSCTYFPSAAAVSVAVFHWLLSVEYLISPTWRGLSFRLASFFSKTVRLTGAPMRGSKCMAEGGIDYVYP